MNPELMATKTGTQRTEHISTAMLEQLVELDARSLSPATARSFLQLGFDRSQQQRVNILSETARRGTLSLDEEQELDECIHVGNLLAILHSKARQALKNVGLSS